MNHLLIREYLDKARTAIRLARNYDSLFQTSSEKTYLRLRDYTLEEAENMMAVAEGVIQGGTAMKRDLECFKCGHQELKSARELATRCPVCYKGTMVEVYND